MLTQQQEYQQITKYTYLSVYRYKQKQTSSRQIILKTEILIQHLLITDLLIDS